MRASCLMAACPQAVVLFLILFSDATILLSSASGAGVAAQQSPVDQPSQQLIPAGENGEAAALLSPPVSAWARRSAKSVLEATDLLAARLTGNGKRFRRKDAALAALFSEQTLDAEAWATARVEAQRLEQGSEAAQGGAAPAPAPMADVPSVDVPDWLDVPRNRAAAKLYASAVAAKLAPPAASTYATQHAAAFAAGSLAPLTRSASVEGATEGMRAGMLPNVEQVAHTNTVAGVATIGGPWQPAS